MVNGNQVYVCVSRMQLGAFLQHDGLRFEQSREFFSGVQEEDMDLPTFKLYQRLAAFLREKGACV